MKKQNIFIDFDGTICFDLFWRNAPDDIKKKITKFLFKENVHLVESWMRGKISSEEIHKIIATNTNLDYHEIFGIFKADCENMKVNLQIIEMIKKCRKNNTTILITDNMDSFNKFTEPQLNLNSIFDYIFNSSDYGFLKDDKNSDGLFKKVINQYNFDIKNSILLDNSKSNCQIFNELGGTSILINNERDTISALKLLE